MEINLINTLNYPFENNSAALKELNQELKLNLDALNIHLISDEELLSINKEYLQHDYYTDIITFDLRDEWSNEAELFISVDHEEEHDTKNNQNEEYNEPIIHEASVENTFSPSTKLNPQDLHL